MRPPADGAPAGVILSGVTRDGNGNADPACTVMIFETATNIIVGSTISDANGLWSINVAYSSANAFYAVVYKVGSPDTFGTTVNTLVGG